MGIRPGCIIGLAEPRSGADAQLRPLLRRSRYWARLTAGVSGL
jgi:hypothetical protein